MAPCVRRLRICYGLATRITGTRSRAPICRRKNGREKPSALLLGSSARGVDWDTIRSPGRRNALAAMALVAEVEPSSGNFAAIGGGFGCGIDASTECAIAGDIVVHKLSPRPLFFASSLCCLPHPAHVVHCPIQREFPHDQTEQRTHSQIAWQCRCSLCSGAGSGGSQAGCCFLVDWSSSDGLSAVGGYVVGR